jgi:hypothetical protein
MQSAVLKMELTSLNIRWVPIPLTVPRCITLVFSHLRLVFQDPVSKTEYCKITLDDANLKAFLYAVKNHYWYQMYLGTKNISFFIASKRLFFYKAFAAYYLRYSSLFRRPSHLGNRWRNR